MRKFARIVCLALAAMFVLNDVGFAMQASAITDPQRYIRQDAWAIDDECVEAGTAAVMLAGGDNLEKILNFLMRKGLNLAQAAGFVGNMQQESGLQPNIAQGGRLIKDDEEYTLQNGVGFGLVQWTFTARQAPLQKFVDEMGVKNTDLAGQLGFVWQELNGDYLSTLNKVRATNDPVEAAVIVHDGYESSADSAEKVRSVRGGFAKEVYDKYKDAPALAGSQASSDMNNPSGEASVNEHGRETTGGGAGGADISKVYILGDSITLGAKEKYEAEFKKAGSDEVKVSASGGGNLKAPGTTGTRLSGQNAIESDKSFIKDATAIVIAHGTNQMSNVASTNPDYLASQQAVVEETIKKVQDINNSAPIFWVDVAISGAAPSNVTPYAGKINQVIYSAQSAGYSVISWAKAVDANVDPATQTTPVNDKDNLLTDGIHPNGAGQDKLVETVINGVKNGGGSSGSSGSSCSSASFAGGDFNETLMNYAWPEFKGLTLEATDAYTAAVKKASSQGLYVGGIAHTGIDCGGFVTLLVRDSGYEPHYNYDGKGGPTSTQEAWMKENWEHLGSSSEISEGSLQPGDVAINSGHTFIYVGDVDGFNAKIASASLDERAPMADNQQSPTQPGYNWYRKK